MIDGGPVLGKYTSNETYFNKPPITDCTGRSDSFRSSPPRPLLLEEESLIPSDTEEWSKEL